MASPNPIIKKVAGAWRVRAPAGTPEWKVAHANRHAEKLNAEAAMTEKIRADMRAMELWAEAEEAYRRRMVEDFLGTGSAKLDRSDKVMPIKATTSAPAYRPPCPPLVEFKNGMDRVSMAVEAREQAILQRILNRIRLWKDFP